MVWGSSPSLWPPVHCTASLCLLLLILDTFDKSCDIPPKISKSSSPNNTFSSSASFFNSLNWSMALLGLHCRAWALSSWGEWGLLSSWGLRATHWGGFLVADPRAWASVVVVVLGLSCSAACGIFLDHGSCLLHWQADSWPLDHSGSPTVMLYAVLCLQKISIGLI